MVQGTPNRMQITFAPSPRTASKESARYPIAARYPKHLRFLPSGPRPAVIRMEIPVQMEEL
jgi:hypothetical protein